MRIINIYSKRTLRMDYGVWLVMIVCALLSLGLLGYKLSSHEACSPELIHINEITANDYDAFDVNQLLRFSYATLTGDQVDWDFGDRSNQVKQGTLVTYQFPTAGTYEVKATIKSGNATCEKMVLIRIRLPQTVFKPRIALEIEGEAYPPEGSVNIYSCNDVANAYLWRVTNAANAQAQNTSSARFTFPKPGVYIIELMLDNNPSKTATKTITVIDMIDKLDIPDLPPVRRNVAPTPLLPPPVVPDPHQQATPPTDNKPVAENADKAKKKDVLPETFKAELDEVIGLKKTPEELAEKYLFYGGTTKVRMNNEPGFKGFTEFCYLMRNSKKYTLQSVSFDKDASGITVINAVLKKNSFFKRLMGKK